VAWGLFCLFGLVVAIQKLFEFPVGSSGWLGGIILIGMSIFAFVSIEGWLLSSQREITVDRDGLRIRSWLDPLLRRPGTTLLWRDVVSASLVFDGGRKLELMTTHGRSAYWAALWPADALTEFLRIARANGIDTRTDWTPGE
jgi:hypothetical protein